ncbi:hypothetical protein AVO45_05765 [Ruegeria marisrubri]|uniref:HTH tetR-type domain-containing protein n=1 Tax=Ruegeria marisrubri TaxID=1685379 RepID=A0A0X3TXS2_9RHOB|nr:TetR family transcriptional regulator C-terminal domain-containing protein [Ruegeria marisrubri]KUJ80553.1 hypothetical protein AVO45_05765 [Ruegeria marisrubri]
MNRSIPSDEQPKAREISKERHRKKLLEAAAEAVFRYGVRGATINKIQEISGLSRGMINLHFQSKENLLQAVAERLARDYTENWRNAARSTDSDPAARLKSIIAADFAPEVLNARNMAIWFAFRAESKSHPEYRPFIDTRESEFRESLLQCCRALADTDGSACVDANVATSALTAILEGMWTDFHLNPDSFDREEALATCLKVAQCLFPGHSASLAGPDPTKAN